MHITESQIQFTRFKEDPSVRHAGMVDFAQVLNVLAQKFPFASLQAAAPQAHATEFLTDPSMFEQVSPRLHVLVDMSQYKPEVNEQAVVPHRHGEVFDIELAVMRHAGPAKQMQTSEEEQYVSSISSSIGMLNNSQPSMPRTKQPGGSPEDDLSPADGVSCNPILTAAAPHDALSPIVCLPGTPTLQNPKSSLG